MFLNDNANMYSVLSICGRYAHSPSALLVGDIRVNRRLDSDVRPVYRLSGVATDGGGLECVADVELMLTDVNDNNPVFDDSVYRHVLPEDSVNNTLLLRVTATDKDAGMSVCGVIDLLYYTKLYAHYCHYQLD